MNFWYNVAFQYNASPRSYNHIHNSLFFCLTLRKIFPPLEIFDIFFLLPLHSQASDQSFSNKKYKCISLHFGKTASQNFKTLISGHEKVQFYFKLATTKYIFTVPLLDWETSSGVCEQVKSQEIFQIGLFNVSCIFFRSLRYGYPAI